MQKVTTGLKVALKILTSEDKYLLEHSLSEQCINHRLAGIISRRFGKRFAVDCEYNRNIANSASIDHMKGIIFGDIDIEDIAPGFEKLDSTRKKNEAERLVRPDIVVHRRGSSSYNYVIIETKKKSNRSNSAKDYDRIKIQKYTEPTGELRYQYGVYIELDDGPTSLGQKRRHLVEIYRAGLRINTLYV